MTQHDGALGQPRTREVREGCLEDIRLELWPKDGQGGEGHPRQGKGMCQGTGSHKNRPRW